MKKSDIAKELHDQFSALPMATIEKFTKLIIQQMSEALAQGRRIELRGFGAFSIRTRKARTGRNPRTGETITVAEKHIPFFKLGKPLLSKINQH